MSQNISSWLSQASSRIKSDSPFLDSELLLSYYLKKNRAYLHAFPEYKITDEILFSLEESLKKMSVGYPLSYITGEKDFWDMTLKVNKYTLIPRSDTEVIVEKCEEILPSDFSGNILDLGTGSGAIAIALSRLFIESSIIATDYSQKALDVAKENANAWQKSKIKFIQADWFCDFYKKDTHVNLPKEYFDIIVSNPPYIEKDDIHLQKLKYEPIGALVSDKRGLNDIAIIIEGAYSRLKNNGWLLLEHGYNQGKDVRELFKSNANWKNINTICDLSNNERVTFAHK